MTPAIMATATLAVALVSFAGGFAVSSWRGDGKITRLERDKQVLEIANRRCTDDIEGVRAGFAELKRVNAKREEAAAAAMHEAQEQATVHVVRAVEIRQAPPVPVNEQCAAIVNEQKAYLAARHN